MTEKKICILGTAPTSKHLAPFKDESVEFWTLAQDNPKRCDVVFEIHDKTICDEYSIDRNKKTIEQHLAAKKAKRVITTSAVNVENNELYPMDKAKELLKRYNASDNYIMSSISYMLILAILEGVNEIHLYGVDMMATDEYAYQRANCEWLVGIAQGMGIKVIVPEQSKILKAGFLYGTKESKHIIKANIDAFNLMISRAGISETNIISAEENLKLLEGCGCVLANLQGKDYSIEYINDIIKMETEKLQRYIDKKFKQEGICRALQYLIKESDGVTITKKLIQNHIQQAQKIYQEQETQKVMDCGAVREAKNAAQIFKHRSLGGK